MADPEVQRRAEDNLVSAIRSAQRQVGGAIRAAQEAALTAARSRPTLNQGLDAATQFSGVLADLLAAREALDTALGRDDVAAGESEAPRG